MGGLLDNPNQQVVRADGSGPGLPRSEQGDEGSAGGDSPADPPNLDEMTKEQLLAYAQQLGVSPANAAMSKAEIRAGVDAKLAETG